MRITEEEADRYAAEHKDVTKFYLLRMHCLYCRKMAGAVVSKNENPKSGLQKIKAGYLCDGCLILLQNAIQRGDNPFVDRNIDQFQERMK